MPNFGQVKQAEKGLIWALVHEPEQGMAALNILQDNDLEGLPTRRVLEEARTLADRPPAQLPSALFERLNPVEAQLVTGIAAATTPPGPAGRVCTGIQRFGCERENAAVQREIDRLQELGGESTIPKSRCSGSANERFIASKSKHCRERVHSVRRWPYRLSCRVRATGWPMAGGTLVD